MNARLRCVRGMLRGLVAFVRYTNSVNDTLRASGVPRYAFAGTETAWKR